MSLLLKALKQAGTAHAARPGRDAPLELERPSSPTGEQAQEWVEPPSLLLGSSGLSAAAAISPQRFRMPQLSIVPLTALLAALVAIGYGIYLYISLQPPAPAPALAVPQAPLAQQTLPDPMLAYAPPALPLIAPAPQVTGPSNVASAPLEDAAMDAPEPAASTSSPTPRVRAPREAPLLSFQPDVGSSELGNAYTAYRNGNLGEAKRLYTRAAARERSVDAVLGLATLAAAQSHDDEAVRLYREVLDRDPRNAAAQAALLDLLGNTDKPATESRLKALIERGPEASLYQTLGNLYAEQNRWSEAQAAYFEAWRGAPENADYAFNLAVSLDRLRQPQAALGYYEKALALGGTPRFERARAEARVRQIKSLP